MGIAEKKLSASERRDIALALIPDAKDQGNGRIQALCPFHADTNPSFYYCYAEDWYRCYGCDERGDLCRLFSRLNNLNDSDGFVEFARRYLGGLPNGGKGRHGYEAPALPRQTPGGPKFTPGDPPPATATWQARARKFADFAHEQLFLPVNGQALEYLHGRGLTDETIRAYRLGWNPKDYFRPLQAWGMTAEKKPNGQWRQLRLAKGWVIPTIVDGTVRRLKIRQTPQELRCNPRAAKYLQVPGGGQGTWIIGSDRQVFVLVETEFDALLVVQAAGDMVGAVPLGSASARPDKEALPILRGASLLVDALDSDEAGARNAGWWAAQFPRNHERCPIPEGKDIGDYVAAGHDLRTWVLACLPPALREVMTGRPVCTPAPKPTTSAPRPRRKAASIEEAEAIMRREIGEGALRDRTLELSLLLRTTPELFAVATPNGGMALRYPPGWDRRNEDRLRRVSRLLFGDAGLAYVNYVDLPVRPDGWWPGR